MLSLVVYFRDMGWLLLCLLIAVYVAAFLLFKGKKDGASLVLIITCNALLLAWSSQDQFLHTWDEQFHALVAKNMVDKPFQPMLYETPLLPYDHENWTANHIWLHKQPLPLWGIAGSLAIFGNHPWAVRLPSCILILLATYIFWSLSRKWFGREVGFVASVLFSFNGLIIELASGRGATDHPDIFFMFFVLLAVFLAQKYAESRNLYINILCGIAIGAAVLCKWLPGLIVMPIWLILTSYGDPKEWRKLAPSFLLLIATTALVALPWQVYIHSWFPDEAAWEASMNRRHLTQVIEERGGGLLYHLWNLGRMLGELVYIPFAMFLYFFGLYRRNKVFQVTLIWAIIPLLFFSLVQTKMQAYLLFSFPAYFLMIAWSFMWLYHRSKRSKQGKLIIVLASLFLVLPARLCIERMKIMDHRERKPNYIEQIEDLKRLPRNTVIVDHPQAIQVMFFTDLVAYDYLPTPEKINDLIEMGYDVVVHDKSSLDERRDY